jgi:UDP:flavonoid glycosyltransferase YjiC (YdhE family)
MRVLVTTRGSAGHFGPLIPFANALRDAGDDVLVATSASTADRVREQGFAVRAYAEPSRAARAPFLERARGLDPGAANRIMVELFVGVDGGAALRDLCAIVADWRPDLVLSEVAEFAGPLAAEQAGIPVAVVAITLGAGERTVTDAVIAALAPLRARLGLRDTPAAEPAYLTLAPPLLDTPGAPHARRFRERPAPSAPLPDWWEGDDAPLVYLTLGTVAPQFGFFPGLFRAAIDALATLPVRVLVTTGRDHDPAQLGPLPRGVHAERWVPQAAVMPHTAAMVCHGGFGTVRAGLAAGVPLAVLPLFADQPDNARRVVELGAGLAPADVTQLAPAVEALLGDPAYAAGAAAVAADERALPVVDEAVALLRDLAAPLLAARR